ncbi:hypothetical protein NC77_20340 [Janthinobacterium lividum]|nr:hypothetical protein NC77_20340 [Janthinobacterium lividum]
MELKNGYANQGITLLLADRSGEEYREVADDISNSSDLLEVKRADAVTFLVDGDRLLDAALRHNVWNDITMIIQGLVEGGALSNSQRVALVLTKFDSIEESEHGERAKEDFAELYAHLLRTMEGKIGRLELFEVAASPKLGVYRRGHGIDKLMKFWLEDSDVAEKLTPLVQVQQRAFARIKPIDE